jgi:hypothetical protein
MQRMHKPVLAAVVSIIATLQPLSSFEPKQDTSPPTNETSAARPVPANSVVYTNKQYGFRILLPKSWKGYSIIVSDWNGRILDSNPEKDEKGPVISIRHPLWTKQNPRQDIPIMVFTLAQWQFIEKEDMAVNAAPIGPSEVGRNANHVFALPARYNFAYLPGWQEVHDILQHKALQAF